MSPKLGAYLRGLREYAPQGRLSVSAAARKSGVSRQTIHKWESGECKPDPEHILALCTTYACSQFQIDQALRLRAAPDPAPAEQTAA